MAEEFGLLTTMMEMDLLLYLVYQDKKCKNYTNEKETNNVLMLYMIIGYASKIIINAFCPFIIYTIIL